MLIEPSGTACKKLALQKILWDDPLVRLGQPFVHLPIMEGKSLFSIWENKMVVRAKNHSEHWIRQQTHLQKKDIYLLQKKAPSFLVSITYPISYPKLASFLVNGLTLKLFQYVALVDSDRKASSGKISCYLQVTGSNPATRRSRNCSVHALVRKTVQC